MKTVPDLLSEANITIDSGWLTVSSPYRDKRMRWQAVSQVLADDKYIYISDSVVAHIIPKSCFTTALEAQSFLNSATEYWQAAKRMPLETADGVWPPAPRIQV